VSSPAFHSSSYHPPSPNPIPTHAHLTDFFIWTTLTCAFTETSLLKLLLDLALLGWVVGRFGPFEDLLEPVRLAALTVVAAVGSSLWTSMWIFLGYVITRWENLFFSPTYGYGPVLMAYLVLLAQKLPSEAVLSSLPSFCGGTNRTLRVQHLPFAWLCLSAALRLLLSTQTASGRGIAMDLPLVACSFVLSWAYLRFFAHNRDGTVGDTSDDFQLVNLLPRVSVLKRRMTGRDMGGREGGVQGGGGSTGTKRWRRRSMRFKNTLTRTFPFLLHCFQISSHYQALRPYLGPLFNFCYGVSTLLGQCKEREVRWFLRSVPLHLSSVFLSACLNLLKNSGPALLHIISVSHQTFPPSYCPTNQLAMASNLIAEEESLLLGRGDDLSGSKGGQQHQHQHHQQHKPKGGSLLVGGAPHKVDPVAERRKAKVSKRGEKHGGGRRRKGVGSKVARGHN